MIILISIKAGFMSRIVSMVFSASIKILVHLILLSNGYSRSLSLAIL